MSDDQAREVIARALIYCCDECKEEWADLTEDADAALDALAAAGLHVLPQGECVIEGRRVRVEPRGFEWPADEFPADPDDNITFFATNNAYWGDEQDVAVARIVPVEGGQ